MNTNIKIIEVLKEEYKDRLTALDDSSLKDPFQILISCLLSLRTRDETTIEASKRLFSIAKSPEEVLRLSKEDIEKAIYPVGFYRKKAETIYEISRRLVKEYNSSVPDTIDELLKFKGVGRKTANIVITHAYQKPGIAVDTHVHRISNRLGLVSTKNPEKTEFALKKVIPEEYWISLNSLFVIHGQTICTPLSPKCSK
ncbi:MAG TPA: endonuclease III, partial [Halobacteria archaeon]|nr:endonuclease III [Halobacteria archaeon]